MEKENIRLEIGVALQINQPSEKVFEAIVNPGEMARYFLSKGSGRMEKSGNFGRQWQCLPG